MTSLAKFKFESSDWNDFRESACYAYAIFSRVTWECTDTSMEELGNIFGIYIYNIAHPA